MRTVLQAWWALALRGGAALLFGVAVLAAPGLGLATLLVLFSAFAFAYGVFSFVSAVRAAHEHERWIGLLLSGFLSLAAGVAALAWPGLTLVSFAYLLAFWSLALGIAELSAAVRLRKVIAHEWFMALGGVLSIALGIVVLLNPVLGVATLAWLVGFYAVLQGVTQVALGFRLKSAENNLTRPAHVP